MNYDSFNNILTIHDTRERAIINALCMTITLKHASLELGISERTLNNFMEENSITNEQIDIMRKRFVLSKKQIKLQYTPIPNGKKTAYRRNH